jgi:hypothetical protein
VSLTRAEYAAAKGLSEEFLESLGVRDGNGRNGHPHLIIPYRNPDGTLFRDRLRLNLKVPEGSRDKRFIWAKAINPENKVCLYGLDRLDEARIAKYVVLVEGESDCHTLWHCSIPAIGVPGATNWDDERDAPHFDGILTVFVAIEPGDGGQALLKKLASSAINKRIRLVWFSEPKDPSGLYLADPANFGARFEEMLQNADPPHEDPDEDRKTVVTMTDDGFFLKDERGELHKVSSWFEVLGRCRMIDATGKTGEWGVLIRFRTRDGVLAEEIVSEEQLHGDLGALAGRLGSMGMYVSRIAKSRQLLAGHLLSQEVNERITLVQRSGWHTIGGQNVFVLPDETIAERSPKETVMLTALAANRQYGAFEKKGTLADWRAGVGRLARGHLLARLGISTALAGPLLRLTGYEGGGIHLWGPSSKGKSTLLMMGLSVWTRARLIDLPSWRATSNGLEAALARASDTFMVLDEVGQADAKEIRAIIYMQAASGKIRMRSDTTLRRDRLTWQTLLLSSGEVTVETKVTEDKQRVRAGHLVRLLDVHATERANGAFDAMAAGVGVSDFVTECRREAAAHYGTAGPEFVHQLLLKGVTGPDILARVDEFVKEALPGAKSDAGQLARAAQRFGWSPQPARWRLSSTSFRGRRAKRRRLRCGRSGSGARRMASQPMKIARRSSRCGA